MDALRLADVRAGTEARAESCGSGYLIGPRLVLTARHVVTGKGGLWPQVEVRIGHPGFGPSTLVAARACWTSRLYRPAQCRHASSQAWRGRRVWQER